MNLAHVADRKNGQRVVISSHSSAARRATRLPGAAIVAAAVLLALPAAAQQPGDKGSSVSKVVRLNRAPVSKDVLRVKLPKPYETTLPNGVRLLVLEDHRFPVVDVQLLILGAGAMEEPAELPGLASATAAMLEEGTRKRSSKQIAEETERLGAEIGFTAAFGGTVAQMNASGLSDNFDQWFALATDQLLHPAFPAEELSKLKQRLSVHLRQQRSSPQFLARERYSLAVYCGNPDDRSTCHPAALVSETPVSIEAMTTERLAAWHRERYVPQNAILAIAGDVQTKPLVETLTRALSEWKRTDLPDEPPPATKAIGERRVFLVDRPKSVQTTIWLGNIAIDRRDADYVPVVVANRVFGGGPAARLFLNLREEKGYTYGVYSNFTAVRYAGPWTASGDVTAGVTEGAMREFFHEINRLRDEAVPDAELDEARRAVVANFALSLEQPQRLLNYAVDRTIYSLPEDYWETYPAKISAVSAADAQRVAQKYLDPAKIQIVAVGDAKQVLPVFQKYGAVKVYDTQGKAEDVPAGVNSTVSPSKVSDDGVGPGAGWSPRGEATKPLEVSGDVQSARIIHQVRPGYPRKARKAHVSGTVRLHAVIAKDGTLQQLEVVSGDPLLAKAAVDAVRKWRYSPTLLNGDPVAVETIIDVVFSL
jgi:zinc protease